TAINLTPDETPGSTFNNSGTVDVSGAFLDIGGLGPNSKGPQDFVNNASQFKVHDGARFECDYAPFNNSGSVSIDNTSSFTCYIGNYDNFAGMMINSGQVNVAGTLDAGGGYTQSAGSTNLAGGTINGGHFKASINGGTFLGFGTILSSVANSG